jgi:general secretion pathway protein M
VSLADRFARLEPREQRLLSIFGMCLVGMVVLGLPVSLTVMVHAKRGENDALRAAAQSIDDSRADLERVKGEKASLAERYAKPCPPLAAFLSGLAKEEGVEIPESQDRQAVPHGKRYTERSTKLALHKIGMYKLAKFMERIEQSGHPVSITGLDLHKRGADPDSYDVEIVVSAFDRKANDDKADKTDKSDKGADGQPAEQTP